MFKIFFILSFLIFNSISFAANLGHFMHIKGSSSTPWMLDEHTLLSLQAMNNLRLYDEETNTTYQWNNNELKLIVVSANLFTDILDKGERTTGFLFNGIRLFEIGMNLISTNKYKRNGKVVTEMLMQSGNYMDYIDGYSEDTLGFNKYPKGLKDNLSRSQGFHFDNLFNYDLIESRWDTMNAWVKRKGIEFQNMKGDTLKPWFCLIGLITHAVQDFYCHSNYVLINSYYGSGSHFIDSSVIPTWEELNDSVWLGNHLSFNREAVLNKLKQSNDETAYSEFIEKNSSIFINGGLQTGNCHNEEVDTTCNMFTCVRFDWPKGSHKYPWGHRHPGKRDQNDIDNINELFNGDYASDREYETAFNLSRKATVWWMNYLLSEEVIGKEKRKAILTRLSKNKDAVQSAFTGCEIHIKKDFFDRLVTANQAK